MGRCDWPNEVLPANTDWDNVDAMVYKAGVGPCKGPDAPDNIGF